MKIRTLFCSSVILIAVLSFGGPFASASENAKATAPTTQQLVDRGMAELTYALERDDHPGILRVISKLKGMGVVYPPALDFIEARALREIGDFIGARDLAHSYVKSEGTDGRYYEEAVKLWVEVKDRADEDETRISRAISSDAENQSPRVTDTLRSSVPRSSGSSSALRYYIEVASNDQLFIINGQQYEAKTYCFNMQEGDPVIFLEGSAYGACASAEILNLRSNDRCGLWCE